MIFAKVENGIICRKISASVMPNEPGWELDKAAVSQVGSRRDFYDDDWKPKPLSKLVSENLMEIPEGYKLENYSFVEMTESEKIKSGILKPTEREKIENGKIVTKTMDELLKDKLITAKEYNEYIDVCRKSEYIAHTDDMRWDILEGKATEADWLDAKNAIRDKYKKVKE